jgi:hypothetical protein
MTVFKEKVNLTEVNDSFAVDCYEVVDDEEC